MRDNTNSYASVVVQSGSDPIPEVPGGSTPVLVMVAAVSRIEIDLVNERCRWLWKAGLTHDESVLEDVLGWMAFESDMDWTMDDPDGKAALQTLIEIGNARHISSAIDNTTGHPFSGSVGNAINTTFVRRIEIDVETKLARWFWGLGFKGSATDVPRVLAVDIVENNLGTWAGGSDPAGTAAFQKLVSLGNALRIARDWP